MTEGTQLRKEEDHMSVRYSVLNSWPQDHILEEHNKFQAGLHWWQVWHLIYQLLRLFSSVADCMCHLTSCSARCCPLASWQIHEEIISSVCRKLPTGFSPNTVLKHFRRLRHSKKVVEWLQVEHEEKQCGLLNQPQPATSFLLSQDLYLRHCRPFYQNMQISCLKNVNFVSYQPVYGTLSGHLR